MKKVIFIVFVIVGSFPVFAEFVQINTDARTNDGQQPGGRNRNGNNSQAPPEVKQAWQRDHGNEGTPSWQQSNGQWRAQYKDQNTNRRVDTYYDHSGRQVDTHREWNRQDMPATYQDNINKRYHTGNSYNVTKIERPNKRQVYQVDINGNGKRKRLFTDEQGNEIRYKDQHRNQ